MTHQRMYALSAALHQLFRTGAHQDLLGFHAYRYKHFVDNSPRGRHCRYALATLRLFAADNEELALRTYLSARGCTKLLELLS